jgi:uncharacterized cupredoxin-like copper-binding protein
MGLRLEGVGAACAVVLLTLTVAACGGQTTTGSSSAPTVRITERDFAIKAPHVLEAGPVHLVVTNEGPVSHELILVRSPNGRLPLRGDGFTVDEDALKAQIVTSFEPDGPGSVRSQDVELTPGRYVLLCNMAGHYMSGMSSSLLVR